MTKGEGALLFPSDFYSTVLDAVQNPNLLSTLTQETEPKTAPSSAM